MIDTSAYLLSAYVVPVLMRGIGEYYTLFTDVVSDRDLLWLVLIFVVVPFVMQEHYRVPIDMIKYVRLTLGVADANLEFLYLRPVWILSLLASFTLFGVTVDAIYFVVMLATVSAVLVVYATGKRLYDRTVGFVAAMLVVTSYSFNQWSLRHLDGLVAAELVAVMLVTWLALERDTRYWFAGIGVVMGVSFATKQVALLLFPLPVCLYHVGQSGGRTVAKEKLVTVYGALGLTLLPWVVLLLLVPEALSGFLDNSFISHLVYAVIGPESGSNSILLSFSDILIFPFVFFTQYVYGTLTLSLLVLVAWVYAAYRAWLARDGTVVLLIGTALLSPFFFYAAVREYRLGQVIVFWLVSYLFVAAFLMRVAEWVRSLVRNVLKGPVLPESVPGRNLLLGVLVLSAPLTVQLYSPPNAGVQRLETSRAPEILTGQPSELQAQHFYNSHYQQDIEGFFPAKNMNNLTVLFSSSRLRHNSVFFAYPSLNYDRVLVVPLVAHDRNRTPRRVVIEEKANSTADAANDHLIYLDVNKADTNPVMVSLTQEDLLKLVREQDTEYLVTTRRQAFLQEYLNAHGGFRDVYQRDGLIIYERTEPRPEPIEYTPRATAAVSAFAESIDEDRQWYRNAVFSEYLGLNATQYRALASDSPEPHFKNVTREDT